MADILNSAILDSAILNKKNHFTHSFWLNLKMAAILKSTNLDSANLHKKTSLIHSDSSWWWQPSWILPSWILSSWIQPFWTIKNFTHSLSPNLMMAAILNSAMLDSATAILDSNTLLSSLRFTQKHYHSILNSDSYWIQPSDSNSLDSNLPWLSSAQDSLKNIYHSTLTLTQTNSIWLKLIHSYFNFMMCSHVELCHLWFSHFEQKHYFTHSFSPNLMMVRPSWILPSWIQPFWTTKKTSVIHSDSSWWWQPSWILPCWIQPLLSWLQTPCYLLSDSLKNSLTPLWLWLKLIQSDSNSFILTQLEDVRHLEFHHHEFGHLGFSHLMYFLSNSLTLAEIGSHHLHIKKLHSFILTQLDDGSHLKYCHVGFRHLGIFCQIHSKTL